jgi:hypothetical protein
LLSWTSRCPYCYSVGIITCPAITEQWRRHWTGRIKFVTRDVIVDTATDVELVGIIENGKADFVIGNAYRKSFRFVAVRICFVTSGSLWI